MDMINLREAPMVDKPEDGAALFALNPDGTINRIKADGVGGDKVHYIDIDFDFANMSVSAVSSLKERTSSESVKIPCSCNTLTFTEAKAAFLAGEYLKFVARGDLSKLMGDDNSFYEIVPIIYATYASRNGEEKIELTGYCKVLQKQASITWTDSEIYYMIDYE